MDRQATIQHDAKAGLKSEPTEKIAWLVTIRAEGSNGKDEGYAKAGFPGG